MAGEFGAEGAGGAGLTDPVGKEFERYRSDERERSEAMEALDAATAAELLAEQVDIATRKVALAREMAHGLPVDVLVTSSREPAGERLFQATYERLGLAEARRTALEKPVLNHEGRRLGSECRLPPVEGAEFIELTTDDTQPFGGDTFRRLQVTFPKSI